MIIRTASRREELPENIEHRRVRVLYDAIGRSEEVAAAQAAWRDHAGQA
jgi:hypothetical protein